MERAVERIRQALGRKQKIAVIGDYDGDGIPGAAIVSLTLRALGARGLLPAVAKGHLVDEPFVRSIAAKKFKVLITVDVGTSSFRAAQLAKQKGIDLIVLDHHVVQHKRPSVYAYINPLQKGDDYPWPYLSGAGLAWKLSSALSRDVFKRNRKYFTALAALAAAHDQMPLADENRMLVHKGLRYLLQLRGADLNTAMRLLKTRESLEKKGHDTVFKLLEYLFNIFESQESLELLLERGHSGRYVKALTDSAVRFHRNLNEGVARVKKHPHFYKKNLIFEMFEDIPYVTAGPVASRVYNLFGVTTFVVRKGEGGLARGSARSSPALNLMDLLLHCEDILSGYGGRPRAVGFAIRNGKIEEFRRRIDAYLKKHFRGGVVPRERLRPDAAVKASELTPALYGEIEKMAPFGPANPVPLLAIKDARLYAGAEDMMIKDRTGAIPASPGDNHQPSDLKGKWTVVGNLAMKGDMLYFKIRELKRHDPGR